MVVSEMEIRVRRKTRVRIGVRRRMRVKRKTRVGIGVRRQKENTRQESMCENKNWW
jgi:hypothetical protein